MNSARDWGEVHRQFRREVARRGPVEMASELGVHRVTVWRWEQGTRVPSRTKVRHIARYVANATREPRANH